MLFSDKLDYMLFLILKKDKKNREKIINILNKIPNEMYQEIQNMLKKYENNKEMGVIEEHNTKSYVNNEYDTMCARYSVPFDELNIKLKNLKKGIDIIINLNEKKGTLSDKGQFITYDIDNRNFIRYNLSKNKKFIIPIVKSCYTHKKPKELSLTYINKKFGR